MYYALIPTIAVIWLTVRFGQTASVSDRSKRNVRRVAIVSVVALLVVPLLAALMQIAICIFIILHEMIVTNSIGDGHRV